MQLTDILVFRDGLDTVQFCENSCQPSWREYGMNTEVRGGLGGEGGEGTVLLLPRDQHFMYVCLFTTIAACRATAGPGYRIPNCIP